MVEPYLVHAAARLRLQLQMEQVRVCDIDKQPRAQGSKHGACKS